MKDVFVLACLQKWLCLDFSIPMYQVIIFEVKPHQIKFICTPYKLGVPKNVHGFFCIKLRSVVRISRIFCLLV